MLITRHCYSAKSNVVNNNKKTANDPPQKDKLVALMDVLPSNEAIRKAEYFGRNIAALGQCQSSLIPLDGVLTMLQTSASLQISSVTLLHKCKTFLLESLHLNH